MNEDSIPVELGQMLVKRPEALAIFAKLRPSHKREYIEYIAEAKKPETRRKRAEGSINMILKYGQGKYGQK